MAIQINATTVIDNSRNLTNISTFDSTVTSAYDTVDAGGAVTLVNRQIRYVTSNSQTITLPSSPSPGNEVEIIVGNYTGVVVGRNGSNIMSLAENMTIDCPYAAVRLIYINDSYGWVLS